MIELLTHSRRRAFNSCRYKHHLAYERAIKPVRSSEALTFGDAAHQALEVYWKARKQGSEPAVATDAMFALLGSCGSKLDALSLAKLGAMLAGYTAHWNAVACEVLAVEREFATPILLPSGRKLRGWMLGGKIDLVLRLADGRVAIVEHKTSGEDVSIGSVYRERLAINGQATQYLHGGASLGHAADVVIFDVLVKPDAKPYKATPESERRYVVDKATKETRLDARQRDRDETAEEYGERCAAKVFAALAEYIVQIEVPRTAAEHALFASDVVTAARLISLTKSRGIHDRNDDACHGKYGTPCEYWAHCSGVASLDDPTMYRVGTQHEELHQLPHAAE